MLSYCLMKHREKWSIVFTSFAISNVFVTTLKGLIFTNALRPMSLVDKGYFLHFVDVIKMYLHHSFPSGHSITAFAVAFTLVLLIKKKNYYKYLFFITAFLVVFNQIYLSEHFPIDVIAGVFIGILSTYLSIYLLSLFKKNKFIIEDPESILFETEIYAS